MDFNLVITAEQAGERIDALLPRLVPELSRSAVQRLLERGGLAVNGRSVKKNYLLRPG
ncbi:MAG: RNA pseudouridine synthase, partial [Oscillospiraceae bacterium]|nr:RNA pseudouridine synthase [Oscillospiraceae bacterium]